MRRLLGVPLIAVVCWRSRRARPTPATAARPGTAGAGPLAVPSTPRAGSSAAR